MLELGHLGRSIRVSGPLCHIFGVAAVLGRNLKIPHARHELPGVMVAFGRDGSANCANLRDLWDVVGRPGLFDRLRLHTTLLTVQEGSQGAASRDLTSC